MDTIEALNHDKEFAMKSANKSEYELMKQIIVVDSGAIALVGAVVANNASKSIALPLQVLLTIAIILLVGSIITAIIQYLVTKDYFLKMHDDFLEILNTLPATGREEYRKEKLKDFSRSSSVVALWMSIISFLAGALVLSAIIVTLIW